MTRRIYAKVKKRVSTSQGILKFNIIFIQIWCFSNTIPSLLDELIGRLNDEFCPTNEPHCTARLSALFFRLVAPHLISRAHSLKFYRNLSDRQIATIVAERAFDFVANRFQSQHGIGSIHGVGYHPPVAGVDQNQQHYHNKNGDVTFNEKAARIQNWRGFNPLAGTIHHHNTQMVLFYIDEVNRVKNLDLA